MNFKRSVAVILLLMMLLSLISGCKTNVSEDEGGAVADTYIESENQELSGDAPEKVEGNNNQSSSGTETPDTNRQPDTNEQPDETPDEQPDETPDTNEQPNETPDKQPGNDETPDEGEGEEEDVTVEYDQANFIKIVDYNIRYTNDGANKMIADRAPRLFALLEKYDPDIIGFQEAVPEWITYIEQGIGDHQALVNKYELRYVYRAATSKECTPILWKKDKFELLDEGYYWLSETPEVSSKSWCNQYYRIANWVKLRVKATGKIFIYVNTHLSGGVAGVPSAELITERTKAEDGITKYPVILTGDFNLKPWSAGYVQFMDSGFVDFNDELGFNSTPTGNGYNEKPDSESRVIDYIMCAGGSEKVVPLKYQVLNEEYFGGYISDHRGLYGEFVLK